MGKLSDIQIKAWIKAGEHFEGRADGNRLYLCNRESFATPKWRFCYSMSGKARAMWIGSYGAKARETVRQLSALCVAGEKKQRKVTAIATIEAEKMPGVCRIWRRNTLSAKSLAAGSISIFSDVVFIKISTPISATSRPRMSGKGRYAAKDRRQRRAHRRQ